MAIRSEGKMRWISLCVLLLLLVLTVPMEAIIVDVPSGKVKCLTEELRKGSLSHAQYRVVNGNGASASHRSISARVSDPNGDALHQHHLEGVDSGHFYFEVATTGRHTACFWSPHFEIAASLSVDVQWNSATRSHAHLSNTNTNSIAQMGTELKKLEDAIQLIHDEMIFLRDSEIDAHSFNQETASKMTSLSLLSLAICLAVATLQLWHLNTFFHTKKIL